MLVGRDISIILLTVKCKVVSSATLRLILRTILSNVVVYTTFEAEIVLFQEKRLNMLHKVHHFSIFHRLSTIMLYGMQHTRK